MFLPQQMQQGRPPMFFGQDPNMQAQMAQPQQMQPPPPVTPQSNPILEALKARQMADAMAGGMDRIQAQDPFGALAKGISGGLEGWMEGRAKEKELANQQAADKEITDALASDDPLKALSKATTREGKALYVQKRLDQLGQKPTEKWQDVDINGDGLADEQVNSNGERKILDRPRSMADELALRRAGANNNVVNVGGGSDKQIYDTLDAGTKIAETAAGGLRGLREAEKALEGPGIYGQYADERLAIAKLGTLLGMDPTAVTNTETFQSAIAPQVAAMVKATVGTANISNADREFAEKAAAGSIKLDPTSLKRLIKIGRRASEAVVNRHNEKVEKVYPAGRNLDRERALFLVPVDQPENIPDWAR